MAPTLAQNTTGTAAPYSTTHPSNTHAAPAAAGTGAPPHASAVHPSAQTTYAPGPGTGGTGTATTATTTTTTNSGNAVAQSGARGLKGVAAAVHGAGETLRGTLNSAVDETFGSAHGTAKNDAVTAHGIDEMTSKKLGAGAETREGVLPGIDHGKRL